MMPLARRLAPAAALLGLIAAPALSQDAASEREAGPDTMIILDGSGSMWGQIEGRAKIEIARDALTGLLADWPEGRAVGLMAYGHRSEGDCGDIETLRAPGALDRDAMVAALGSVTPTGKTPIGAAVQRAAETLSSADRPASVILVTDGVETCQADLCEVGQALEQGGVGFTAHVVGFDVEDDSGALACLANETGGEYLAAADADSLNAALKTARESAPAPMEAALVEPFDGDALSEGWEVINPVPSAFLVGDGVLTAMTAQPGDMGSVEPANIFRWTGAELPDGDFAITAAFTARMGEVQTLGGRRSVVQVGSYQDADNYMAVEIAKQGNSNDDMWLRLRVVAGGNETVDALEIAGDTSGYNLTQILDDFETKGARLSLVKRGREHVGRLETPGWSLQPGDEGVYETEPVTVLRGSGAPALFAGTRGPEQTLVEFDRIEVKQAGGSAQGE